MTYSIGGHIIIIHAPEQLLRQLLPSFTPFIVDTHDEAHEAQATMQLYLDNNPATDRAASHSVNTAADEVGNSEAKRFVRDVDTGNGITRVERYNNGAYRF